MATVMWDNDGVISGWVENFYPWLCERRGIEPTEWLIWHHYRNHGISDEDFVAELHEYARQGLFGDQVIYPGVREAVIQIKAAGHSQHIVTDRPPHAEADTAWWVDTYLPEIDTLTVSRDKTVFMDYGDPVYYALDDRVENVASLRAVGVEAYLLTWPWNEGVDLPRVASAKEFADIVCA